MARLHQFVLLAIALSVSEASAVDYKVEIVEATPYSELTTRRATNGVETGVKQVLKPAAGKILVQVAFRVTVTWDDATENLTFDATQFHLDEGKTVVAYRGGMDFTGEFALMDAGGFYAYRPFDWAEKKQPSTTEANGWWEVSSTAKDLTLHVGTKSTPVKVEGKPAPYEPKEPFAIQVAGTKLKDEVVEQRGFEKPFSVSLVNEGGSILEVQLKVAHKQKPADAEAAQKLWGTLTTQKFYLTFGKGGRAVALGHLNSDKKFQAAGPLFLFTEDPTKPINITVYFAAPSNLKAFDVIYDGRQVAQGTIGPAAK